jgi:hypothetical protein
MKESDMEIITLDPVTAYLISVGEISEAEANKYLSMLEPT